ncbi:MAG: hypothetical protein JWM67_3446, partial [Mycobacterium sp.]|nr:hypothetical protein [Mycobacterium sp.]
PLPVLGVPSPAPRVGAEAARLARAD